MHAQLARSGAEQVALDAYDVADVEDLVELEIGVRNLALSHIDLKPLSAGQQVREARLTHAADGLDAPADAHLNARFELRGAFRVVLRADVRDGIGEVKAPSVGLESQRFDLADALQALLQQLLFQAISPPAVGRRLSSSSGWPPALKLQRSGAGSQTPAVGRRLSNSSGWPPALKLQL